jgi:hypothetical protein
MVGGPIGSSTGPTKTMPSTQRPAPPSLPELTLAMPARDQDASAADVDDDIFEDQDDAQSFIQPAISPIATRLTSLKTPAAEKAAAMDRLPGGGLFEVSETRDGSSPSPSPPLHDPQERRATATGCFSGPPLRSGSPPNKLTKPQPRDRNLAPKHSPSSTSTSTSPQPQSPSLGLPTPWRSGPKDFVTRDRSSASRSVMASVFGNPTNRHQRSSSVSENALKRLSKALDSFSLPGTFIPNISTQNFFTSNTSQQKPDGSPSTSPRPQQYTLPIPAQFQSQREDACSQLDGAANAGSSLPQPGATRRPHVLRRSTSNDSLLYHSLSRATSFGDDARFSHIREQVNSRFKAIKDSFDGPSFKLPQMPSKWANPLWYLPRISL